MQKQILRVLLLVALLILAGCFEQTSTEVANNTTIENKTKPVLQPSFIIINPEENEQITVEGKSGPVTIILNTKNLVLRQGGEKKIGEGYFVFILDDGEPIKVYEKTYTFENVPVGEHTVYVELVHNDGTPYTPRITRSVHFSVASSIKEYTPSTYTIIINDFSYEPASIEVNVGDTVVWVNNGKFPRSATCTGLFDTQIIAPGKNASITMTQPLECDFMSLNQPNMKGHIKVNLAPGS
ncbi:MAG: hypothetical protein QXF70_02490 [Candidatus Bilamarchaeaceae archaeon]